MQHAMIKDMTEEKHSLMTDLDEVFNEAGEYSWKEIRAPGFSRCLPLSQLWCGWLCCRCPVKVC